MLMLVTMMLAAMPGIRIQEPVSAGQQQGSPPVAATQANVARQATPPVPSAPSANEKQVITVPAGTKIPLTLANPIKPKAARRGDSVRALTAFPVAVNDQVAIPAGVYVEGVIEKPVKKDRWGHPWVEVHFTRMVFPNGYVLPLEGQSTEARANEPTEDQVSSTIAGGRQHENGPSGESAFEFQLQQPPPPTLPPLPKPNYAPEIALGAAGAAAAVALIVYGARHRYDEFFYDVGWQFDMILQAPLKVDVATWSPDAGN